MADTKLSALTAATPAAGDLVYLVQGGNSLQTAVAMIPYQLAVLVASLRAWQVTPEGSEGWRKAEVTLGGVDTRELDGQSLQFAYDTFSNYRYGSIIYFCLFLQLFNF